MSDRPPQVTLRVSTAPGADSADPGPDAPVHWRDALADAQGRRIRDLEQRLAERTRVLTDAACALAREIRRRESAQAALAEAQRLEAIGQLAGGMVHDLRNVLGAIGMGHQICKLKTTDPELLEVVDSGSRALGQANGLMDSLLGLMRRQEDSAVEIEPSEWLSQMAGLLGYAAGRQATCRIQAPPRSWPVRAVEHRLGAALVNLIANARDAMPYGGETVVALANLSSGADRPPEVPDGDFVVFSVTDTGCGMTPDVLARATEALFSTKPRGEGTGLGLAMVRDFARASGGYLHIESAPGSGTRVALYLPRSDGSRVDEGASGSTQQLVPPADLTADGADSDPGRNTAAGTLMLVDGEDLARASLAASLRAGGWEVVESTGPEIALALLHTCPRLVGVIADLDLPGLDGALFVRRLRLERPLLPVLLLTARSLPGGASLAGAPVLHKTLDANVLDKVLGREIARLGAARDDRETLLDRLLVRVRSPGLLVALLGWREARGGAKLPDLAVLTRSVPELEASTFLAEPQESADSPAFRFLTVGADLNRQLGRSLDGASPGATGEETLDKLAVAYRRASRAGLPTYEHARYSLGDEPAISFERLILPASRDGETVSHLLGIVLFANLPDARIPGVDNKDDHR